MSEVLQGFTNWPIREAAFGLREFFLVKADDVLNASENRDLHESTRIAA